MSANGLSSVPLSWKNITVRLGQLKPWDHNPRQSTEKQSRALVRSWDKFGQVHLFAVDPVFNVIDGHQRLTGLLLDHGPDFRVEARQSNRQLTDAEQRELSVTLHQGAVGHWDWDELGKWDGVDLVDWGFDGDTLTDWTRDVGALNNLLESENPEPPDDPGAQIDKAEELREKWQTETGQLWIIPSATGDGEHRIICGDCTAAEVVARVMGGEKAGAVVTDSPYGIEREGVNNDDPEGLRSLFDGCLSVLPVDDAVIVNFQSPRLFPVWLSACENSGLAFERALWSYKPNGIRFPWRGWILKSDIILLHTSGNPPWPNNPPNCHDTYTYTHEYELKESGGWHGSVKPMSVIESLVGHTSGSIYDPFLGSGTTAVAAERLARQCRGVEISPAYVAVSLERLAQMGLEPYPEN